jgi:L-lactate dehydrogenase complex protein LldF
VSEEIIQPPGRFREVARTKLADAHVERALDFSTERLFAHRVSAWEALEDVEALRERGREIRSRTVADLDRHLADFTQAVERQGGQVRLCRTAEEANAYVLDICRRVGAKLVAKGKSMASEEIRLNDALAAEGIRAVETDLGEYVLQLSGEHPVHIVAPAIEKTKEDVAALFSRVEGLDVEPELEALTQVARRRLREVFLQADVGVTGANFGVAETGSVVLVTNEGNGRMCSSLPRVHVAIMGMERVVPTLADLAVLLELLGRSGTGQKLTVYTTLLSGPRRADEKDGPEELHVVLLDNGRSNLVGSRYQEMLNCIRCGSCLNVCPVFRKTGGAAYGPVYSGPMGAVLAPLLVGLDHAPSLPHASSLCGHCTAACPVKIPLHEYLLDLRRDLVDERIASRSERLAFTLWSYAWSRPWSYRLSTWLGRLGQPLGGSLGPGKAWAAERALPRLGRRYRDRRRSSGGGGGEAS